MSALKAGLKDSISSIVTLLAGLFFLISVPSQIADFGNDGLSGVSARTMPYLIAGGIVAFSLFSIIVNIWTSQGIEQSAPDASAQSKTRYGLVFLAFVAIALWIIALPYIGYTIATILLITSLMLIIGNCTWWQIAILSLALSFPINYLLALVLKVYLPSGSLFN